MVVSAARRLHVTRGDVDVVLGGGIFTCGDQSFLERVTAAIHTVVPAARVRRLDVPPLVGAALLAGDRLGLAVGAARRLRRTLTAERVLTREA